jgi:hypothetical protein
MKRHIKIFFLLFSLFSAGIFTKSIAAGNHHHTNSLINSSGILHACPTTGMNGNRPSSGPQLLLFRNGVDEKGILFSPKTCKQTTLCLTQIPDTFLVNTGKVKYILSFSEFLFLPPEFLSSSLFRSPPALC